MGDTLMKKLLFGLILSLPLPVHADLLYSKPSTGLVPGSTILGPCTASSFLYADPTKVVQCNGPTYVNSGTGNGTFGLIKTPAESGDVIGLSWTQTGPQVNTAADTFVGAYFKYAPGLNTPNPLVLPMAVELGAGATSGKKVVFSAYTDNAGSSGSTFLGTGPRASDIGTSNANTVIFASWLGQQTAVAVHGYAARGVGVIGETSNNAQPSTGVWGNAVNGTNTGATGGYFTMNSGSGNPIGGAINLKAALMANNVAQAVPIFIALDNNTSVVTIEDGGPITLNTQILTAATMTAETTAQLRTTTHSYTWSNAQVVALGAVLAGDITVATLPIKSQVIDAAVVITGSAVGPATVTVSCGRTAAAFIDYIVASDAKAAVNTVYGDAAAERGTNLTGYDLPSYVATTTVTCHFISTGANLDTVTGSTGRVILTTRLLP